MNEQDIMANVIPLTDSDVTKILEKIPRASLIPNRNLLAL